ncbi:peptidoglycan editing factor PgeF [Andreprevotia chitinilytica]|uniref:peptidoglycan editing factor PgeF n=1 Tax=Andreprevotia chitinilytica TaxID=396808 RepID=UPI00055372B6|nr:peptidoglycan editing factor PgeF [Andreprevotia chitinilytica]
MSANDWIVPDWPAPARVRSLVTTRTGGLSAPPYTSLNLGDHVGDDPAAVAANRARVRQQLPAEPLWLTQVHGTHVADALTAPQASEADAIVAHQPGAVCAIMTADCLPVLLCNRNGTVVGAAHAGWRGLCDGVIETTAQSMNVPGEEVLAWLGPAIGPEKFEVGDEVRAAFVANDLAAAQAFKPGAQAGKWLADIYLLARQRLAAIGVTAVYGGDFCTVSDAERFFSYRRDKITGRMASLIWLQD